ncbi:hypothetical protein [Cohnella mopanensis]|uniref:hypothetical protein n=1 Tax=Cohnella mopanensis TaxID=2911966 RepID=UPI001EF834A2|nr:hypothetical protein [Cohnella mopanensis]
MRKYRSWLMGLGIGIIVGASMLQLILLANDQMDKVVKPLTREELNDQAKQAGLVLLTKAQLDEQLNDAVAAAKEKSETEDNKGEGDGSEPALTTPEENNGEQSPSSSSEAKETEQTEASEPATPKEYTLYVSYGMTLTEVANSLLGLGIIEDTEDFINHARPIAKKMNVGNAVFSGKPTYKQIMSELTRKK